MELIILNLILLASTLYFANKVRKIDKGQKQLKEENKLLKEAQAVGKIGSWSGSLEDDIVWWSEELYRLYGLDPNTYTPRRGDFYNLVFEDDRDSYRQAIGIALEKGEDFKIKFRRIHPTDGLRWYESEGISFITENGSKGFHGTVRDITDEQNYIKKINENEFILRNAQENAKIGIWIYNLNTKERYWSDELFKFFDFKENKLPEIEHVFQKIHPDDRDYYSETINNLFNGEVFEKLEYRVISDDGSIKYMLSYGTGLKDQNDKLIKLIGTTQDVTQLKVTENSLKEAQSITRTGNWSFDPRTNEVFWSDEMFKIYNRDFELGQPDGIEWGSYILPEDLEMLYKLLEGKSDHSAKDGFIVRIIDPKTGELKYLEGRERFVKDSKGEIIKVFGTNQDITEKVRIEKELKNSLRFLNDTQSVAKIGSWFWNIKTDIVKWSDQTWEILEFDKSVPSNFESFLNIVIDTDKPKVENAIENAVEGKEDYRLDVEIKTPKGNKKYIQIIADVTRDEEGEALSMTGTISDITERKIKENELEKINNRFIETQEIANIGSWKWDFDTGELNWSDQLYKIFGFEPNQKPNNDRVRSQILEEDHDVYDQAFVLMGQGKILPQIKYRIKKADNDEIRNLVTHAIGETDKDGNIISLHGTIQDITPFQTLEDQLINSEKNLSAIIENTSDIIMSIDRDYRLLMFNSNAFITFKQVMNMELEIGKKLTDYVPKEDVKKWEQRHDRAFAGESYQIIDESEIDGQKLYSEVSFNPIKTDDEIRSISLFVKDVTLIKEKELQLERSEKRFREITELLPVAVFETDDKMNFTYFNKKTIDWFEFSEEDIAKDQNLIELIADSDKERARLNLKRKLNKEDIGIEEYTATRKNGEIFDVLLYQTSFLNNKGENCIRGVLLDISDKKKREKELENISKLESLGILAGGIAHNFKNILTSISISLELIKQKPEDMNKFLNRISIGVKQANALATKFQTFTKSSEPEKDSTSINAVVIEASEIAFSGTGVKVNFYLDDDLPNIMADAKQLNEVFMNLFINASQAMPKGGNIYIDTNSEKVEQKEYIKIIIRDEGSGIPKEKIDEIFTPFFTTKADGHGLGLATVYNIIKKHNGFIKVDSEIGNGTEFSVFLPLMLSAENEKIEILEAEEIIDSSINVILIDDEPFITESLSEIVNFHSNINLDCYNDPYEGIEVFRDNTSTVKYDLAILDITLTGYDIDGLDVLKKLKEIDPDLKTVVFSAHAEKPVVAKFEEYGFDARLPKPCGFKDVELAIKRAMANKKSQA